MFELDFAAQVDRSIVRETSSDVARAIPRLGLALVADGSGGQDLGEIASRTAADESERSFSRLGGPGVNSDDTAQRLESAFRDANQRMVALQTTNEARSRTGVSLIAAVFAHGRVVIGNVGVCRCYRLRNRSLELLTQEHPLAGQLMVGIKTTPEARQATRERESITPRCLDGDEGVIADIRIVRCEPGDVFLLCSDGLWGRVAADVMAAMLGASQDAREACERLVSAAWARGALDNIGIAVVRAVPLQLRLDEPSWLERPLRPSQYPGGDV